MEWLSKFMLIMKNVVSIILKRMGVWSALTVTVAYIFTDDAVGLWAKVKGYFYDAFCVIVEEKTTLILNREDPLSDASISAALTAKSGIAINSVMKSEVLVADLSAHASGLIQEQTGVYLSNLLSAEQVKADVVTHAQNVVQEKTGLNIAGAKSFDDVQKSISAHVRERLAELVADRLRDAAESFARPEASLDDLLAMVYRAQEAKGIRVRDVALGTAASIVVAAYARTSVPLKRRVDAFRRRAQNREAQRRFRARHGNRMRYDKLPVAEEPGG